MIFQTREFCPGIGILRIQMRVLRGRGERNPHQDFVAKELWGNFWLSQLTLQKEIVSTIYSVTGAYDGTEAPDKKMERVMTERFMDKAEDSE